MPRKVADSKPKDAKKSLAAFLNSLKGFRFLIIISLVFAVISNLLGLLSPKLLGNMTNSAYASLSETGHLDLEPIKLIAVQLIIIYLVSAILSYFESYLIAYVTAKYTKNLRAKIIEKISRLPISYFDKTQFGDTLSIYSNDTDTLWDTLTEGITQILTSITTIVGCMVMMTIISPLLAIVAIVVVPISTFLVSRVAKKAQGYFVSQRKTLGKLNSHIEEDYSGQLIIKSNSHEAESIKEFKKINEKLYEESWRGQFLGSLAFPLVHTLTNLGYVGVCVLGGNLVLSGKILIGSIQAFVQYLSRFNRPLTNLSEIVVTIQQTLAASERIFNFLDEPEEEPEPKNPKLIKSVKGAVEFNHVSFSYDKKTPIIKDFSAKIKAGEQVAIVGPTGAGKTTIINLLMRFYDPDSGFITIDGIPTKEMKRSDVRKLFGMVLQDTWLFSGTIFENLKYGSKKASLEDVKTAAKITGINHLVESMKNGYDSEISEDSDNISAGENNS